MVFILAVLALVAQAVSAIILIPNMRPASPWRKGWITIFIVCIGLTTYRLVDLVLLATGVTTPSIMTILLSFFNALLFLCGAVFATYYARHHIRKDFNVRDLENRYDALSLENTELKRVTERQSKDSGELSSDLGKAFQDLFEEISLPALLCKEGKILRGNRAILDLLEAKSGDIEQKELQHVVHGISTPNKGTCVLSSEHHKTPVNPTTIPYLTESGEMITLLILYPKIYSMTPIPKEISELERELQEVQQENQMYIESLTSQDEQIVKLRQELLFVSEKLEATASEPVEDSHVDIEDYELSTDKEMLQNTIADLEAQIEDQAIQITMLEDQLESFEEDGKNSTPNAHKASTPEVSEELTQLQQDLAIAREEITKLLEERVSIEEVIATYEEKASQNSITEDKDNGYTEDPESPAMTPPTEEFPPQEEPWQEDLFPPSHEEVAYLRNMISDLERSNEKLKQDLETFTNSLYSETTEEYFEEDDEDNFTDDFDESDEPSLFDDPSLFDEQPEESTSESKDLENEIEELKKYHEKELNDLNDQLLADFEETISQIETDLKEQLLTATEQSLHQEELLKELAEQKEKIAIQLEESEEAKNLALQQSIDLEEKIKELESTPPQNDTTSDEDLRKLQQEYDEVKETLTALTEVVTEHEKKEIELAIQIEEQELTISKSEKELGELTEEHKQIIEELERTKKEYDSLEPSMVKALEEKESLQETLQTAEEQVKTLSNQVETLEREMKELASTVQDTPVNHEEVEQLQQALKETQEALALTIEEEKASQETLKAEIKDNNTKLKDLRKSKRELNKTVKELKAQIKETPQDITELASLLQEEKNQKESLEKQIEKLNKSVEEKTSALVKLEEENKKIIDQESEKLQSLEDQTETLSQEIEKAKASEQKLEKKIAKSISVEQELQEEISELTEQLSCSTSPEETAKLKEQIGNLEEQVTGEQLAKESLKAEISTLKEERTGLEEIIQQLKQRTLILEQKLASTETLHTQTTEKHEKLRQKTTVAKSDLKQVKGSITHPPENSKTLELLNKSQSEVARLNAELTETEESNLQLTSQLTRAIEHNKTLTEVIKRWEREEKKQDLRIHRQMTLKTGKLREMLSELKEKTVIEEDEYYGE